MLVLTVERVAVIDQLEQCATTHHRERSRAARVSPFDL
jgi:hypothetical protein